MSNEIPPISVLEKTFKRQVIELHWLDRGVLHVEDVEAVGLEENNLLFFDGYGVYRMPRKDIVKPKRFQLEE